MPARPRSEPSAVRIPAPAPLLYNTAWGGLFHQPSGAARPTGLERILGLKEQVITKPDELAACCQRIAETALQRFGGFDTWINDTGVTVFGRIEEIAIEDHRRLFETNFWGLVYGSLAAVRQLRTRGGALVKVGSVASDRAFPLEGMYSASKHAVKGFTDALRMELEKDGAPVSVSLIKPTAIATPLPQHAGNYMADEPTPPPPVYAPELVAEAILHCAQHPVRDLFVGRAAKALATSGAMAPRLTDKLMEATMFRQQHTGQPKRGSHGGSLYRPSHDLAERGEYQRHSFESSIYTKARMHPLVTGAAALGAGLAAVGIWQLLRGGPAASGQGQAEAH